jgi:glycerophosphoryl diester phosphodiesterase
MIKILSHRGYWLKPEEKNTVEAFERSFSLGFGTETDIRDYNGELVVSHDIATSNSIAFEDFLKIYVMYDKQLLLALNIKSDGLQDKLTELLRQYAVTNYFVFDMSIPEAVVYCKKNISMYTRQSEYETVPSLYQESAGVWIDGFISDWVTPSTIIKHIDAGKKVCLVSPDLHRREHVDFWKKLKQTEELLRSDQLFLCTDYPKEAREYFYGK